MNVEPGITAKEAIYRAKVALRQGYRQDARRWAERAVALAPTEEEAWLILAGLSKPETSLVYLKRVLEINPASRSAREGIHWALQRQRSSRRITSTGKTQPLHLHQRLQTEIPVPDRALVYPQTPVVAILLIVLVLLSAGVLWFATPSIGQALDGISSLESAPHSVALLAKNTITPTFTATFTPTPAPTATPTFTPTATFTETPIPTDTPTETPTPTLQPTEAPTEAQVEAPSLPGDVEVGSDEHWIDVDLSTQRAYAYDGKHLVKSFLVSTGTWAHPTVTGQYHVYVRYRYADMTGPGYYLPDVPYVMYFYDGYGLHGTYWHHNFGTPMSHGCVNFSIEDAHWIYDFTSLGTLVNVHN